MRCFNAQTLNIETEKSQAASPIPIKVKINKTYSEEDLLEEGLEKARAAETPICYYPKAHKIKWEKRWSGVKKDMKYSKHKLNAVAGCVRGKPLIDAKAILNNVDKKGAKFIYELLDEMEEQGVSRGRDPERMVVHTITVGGSILHKKPDIKGRGRTGIISKPVSNMRIVMAEKSIADFYCMML